MCSARSALVILACACTSRPAPASMQNGTRSSSGSTRLSTGTSKTCASPCSRETDATPSGHPPGRVYEHHCTSILLCRICAQRFPLSLTNHTCVRISLRRATRPATGRARAPPPPTPAPPPQPHTTRPPPTTIGRRKGGYPVVSNPANRRQCACDCAPEKTSVSDPSRGRGAAKYHSDWFRARTEG